MKRFTAEYVYTLTGEPLRHAFVEVEEDGTVIRTGPNENFCSKRFP